MFWKVPKKKRSAETNDLVAAGSARPELGLRRW
jgi:hypothetical protein